MSSDTNPISYRSSSPDTSYRFLLRPGGAGDRVIFGYVFRLIYSVGAVIFGVASTLFIMFALDESFSGGTFVFFCATCLLIMAIGEGIRTSVYESRLARSDNSLKRQDLKREVIYHYQLHDLILHASDHEFSNFFRIQKRLFDVIIGLVLLVALSPLLFVVALIIKFDSRGPILFEQRRIGQSGKVFSVYKFRTMQVELPGQGSDPFDEYSLSESEQAITTAGRFLRRTAIDELPQIWNVLKGDMSLVGPRPLPFHLSVLTSSKFLSDANAKRIFLLKPGITGLDPEPKDSTPLRKNFSAEEEMQNLIKLQDDYIAKWSLLKDLSIFIRTCFLIYKNRI